MEYVFDLLYLSVQLTQYWGSITKELSNDY